MLALARTRRGNRPMILFQNIVETEEARRSIRAAYHGVTAKLQHFPLFRLSSVSLPPKMRKVRDDPPYSGPSHPLMVRR